MKRAQFVAHGWFVRVVLLFAATHCIAINAQILKGTRFLYGPPMVASSQFGLDADVSARNAMAVDGNSSVYLTGAGTAGSPGTDWLTVKYNASGVEQWRAVLNGRANNGVADNAYNVRVGPDGNPVVVGSSSLQAAGGRRCTAAKYDAATGKELWRNWPSLPAATPAWAESECLGMIIDSVGDIVIVGRTREQYNFGNADVYVAKLSATGSLVWHRTLANGAYAPAIVPPNTISAGSADLAAFVTVDGGNNIYVAGRTQEGASNYVWAIFKIAPTGGAPLWRTNVGGTGDSRVRAVAVDAGATRVAVVGTRESRPGYSVLDASSGAVLADVSLGAPSSTGYLADVAFVNTDIVVAGYELLSGGTEGRALVSRANVAGSVWNMTKSSGVGTRSAANAMAVSGNDIAITGNVGTLPAASGDADLDIYSFRVDAASGAAVGSAIAYQGPGQVATATSARDYGSAIKSDGIGGFFVGGTMANNTTPQRTTMGVVRYSSTLAQLWAAQPAAARAGMRLGNLDGALAKRSMVLDDSGNAYFATLAHNGASTQVDVIKWDSTLMSELWRCSYNASVTSFDIPYSISLDASGNVFVTGDTGGPQTTNRTDNAFAFKVLNAGNSCSIAWSKSFNTLGASDPGSFALAGQVDANGDLLLAGETFSSPTDAATGDWLVVKLSGSTGNELWRHVSDGGSNLEDRAIHIRTAPGGVVYVGGWSYTSATSRSWRVLRLQDNGVSATVNWTVTHPSTGIDLPYAMHVEPDGSKLYVAGYIDQTAIAGAGGQNMALRIYTNLASAAPTSQLVAMTGNNSTGSGDFAKDVVSDPVGNIYLSGMLNNTGGQEEFTVLKLDPSGSELWRKSFGGTAGLNYDEASAVALTSDGPVATGFLFTGVNYYVMGTAQLRASDGALMWYVKNESKARDLGLAVKAMPASFAAAPGRVVIAGWGGENNSVNSLTQLPLPQTLVVQVVDRAACTIKVDGRAGGARATTDGLIILRHILLVGEPAASSGTATQNSIDDRDNLVSTLIARKDYDIDGDGTVDAKDGLLILRYLLGVRGDAISAGLGLTGGRSTWLPASPTTDNSIKLYLEACGV